MSNVKSYSISHMKVYTISVHLNHLKMVHNFWQPVAPSQGPLYLDLTKKNPHDSVPNGQSKFLTPYAIRWLSVNLNHLITANGRSCGNVASKIKSSIFTLVLHIDVYSN